jgi:toxin YoeB
MELKFTPEAKADRDWWKQHGNDATKRKIQRLLGELEEHPRTGTGKPELLKGDMAGVWSRHIKQERPHSLRDSRRNRNCLCTLHEEPLW